MKVEQSETRLHFDERPRRKRIGLIILATCHSSEPDFHAFVGGPDVGIYTARIFYENPTTPENLRKTLPRLTEAASLIFPDQEVDAICYSCTSASMVIGDDAVAGAIQAVKPGVPVVTPTRAVVAALSALDARTVDILTPYNRETSTMMGEYIAGAGFDVQHLTYFGLEDDRDMARIAPASLVEAAAEACSDEADALFISCTALRAASAAADIEARIGKPVVTSNLATAWMVRRLAGIDTPVSSRARLFGLPL
ncbi:ectoine utilization protein EutA [Pseudochelatococcus sp. B33]